jgi:N utilization substance protein A
VRIHPDTGTAEVIVPDFQLSLAIGKEGQNARLAARLTGWRVDIKSETQLAEEEAGGGVEYAEGEWVTSEAGELVWQPAEGGEAISAAEAGYAAPGAPQPAEAGVPATPSNVAASPQPEQAEEEAQAEVPATASNAASPEPEQAEEEAQAEVQRAEAETPEPPQAETPETSPNAAASPQPEEAEKQAQAEKKEAVGQGAGDA